jgi:hypothetical protein
MNGELDFNQSLKARVSLLSGQDINELFSKVIQVCLCLSCMFVSFFPFFFGFFIRFFV